MMEEEVKHKPLGYQSYHDSENGSAARVDEQNSETETVEEDLGARQSSGELLVQDVSSPTAQRSSYLNVSTVIEIFEQATGGSEEGNCCVNWIQCSNNCGKVLESSVELQKHIIEECPLTVVDCEFKHVGCDVRLPRRALATHLAQAVVIHLSQQMEKYKRRMKALEEDNELLAIKYKRLEMDYSELKQKMDETCDALKKLTDKTKGVSRTGQKSANGRWTHRYVNDEELSVHLNRSEQPSLMTVTRRPPSSENSAATGNLSNEPRSPSAANSDYANAEAIQLHQKKVDYSYVFTTKSQSSSPLPVARAFSQAELTMANFEQHQLNDDHWISQPFFSREKGYKMCLRVIANGQGTGKGTHISVVVYLMKGEFDDELDWPFRGDITIQLLNQEGSDDHHVKTIYNAKGERGESNNGERFISAWAVSQYILHSKLSPKYLKDDSLKFEVSTVVKQQRADLSTPQLIETEV